MDRLLHLRTRKLISTLDGLVMLGGKMITEMTLACRGEDGNIYKIILKADDINRLLEVLMQRKSTDRINIYTTGPNFGTPLDWVIRPAEPNTLHLWMDLHESSTGVTLTKEQVSALMVWQGENTFLPEMCPNKPEMAGYSITHIKAWVQLGQKKLIKDVWGLLGYVKFLEGQLRIRTDSDYKADVSHIEDRNVVGFYVQDEELFLPYLPSAEDEWVWDGNKLTFEEAHLRYPRDKWFWLSLDDEDVGQKHE